MTDNNIGIRNALTSQIDHLCNKISALHAEAGAVARQIDAPIFGSSSVHIKSLAIRLTAVADIIQVYEAEMDRIEQKRKML